MSVIWWSGDLLRWLCAFKACQQILNLTFWWGCYRRHVLNVHRMAGAQTEPDEEAKRVRSFNSLNYSLSPVPLLRL